MKSFSKTLLILVIWWTVSVLNLQPNPGVEGRRPSSATRQSVQQFNQLPLDVVEFFEEYTPQSSEVLDTQEQPVLGEDFHFDGVAGFQDSQFGSSESDDKSVAPDSFTTPSEDVDMCRDVRCRSGQLCVQRQPGLAACIPFQFAHLQHHRPFTPFSTSNGKKLFASSKLASRNAIGDHSSTTFTPTTASSTPAPASSTSTEKNIMNRYLSYVYDNLPTPTEVDSSAGHKCDECEDGQGHFNFFCGSDGRSYSSLCSLERHNCIAQQSVSVLCHGLCPCVQDYQQKEKQERIETRARKFSQTLQRDHLKKKQSNSSAIKLPAKAKFIDSNSIDCNQLQLIDVGERLYDWLGLIYAQHQRQLSLNHEADNASTVKQYGLSTCGQRLDWMFSHLDGGGNGDGRLSVSELYDAQQKQRERCLRPFVNSCDLNQDDHLDQKEWCTCFERLQPCAAQQRRLRNQFSSSPGRSSVVGNSASAGRRRAGRLIGAYTPQCDRDGRFRPLQCNPSTGFCWCVDIHGQPMGSSRRRGPVNCDNLKSTVGSKTNNSSSSSSRSHEEDDDAESDEEEESVESDEEGSGELPTE